MSDRYPGGLITKTPVTPTGPYQDGTAPGIWTLEQQAYWQAQGLWPTAGSTNPGDPYFKYVTMLLTGNGTNGAQNNTFLDSSTNAFTITRNGNTTQGSFSPYGSLWSNYFDGASDYLTVPNNAALNFGSGDFTIEFWINLPSDVGSGPVVAMGQSGGSNSQFSVFCDGSQLSFYAATNSSGWTGLTADAVTYNTWQHWAFVKSSGTLYVYRNGTLASSASLGTLNNDTTHALTIATQYTSGGVLPNTSQDIKGYISNLRIVKGTAVYTSAFTPSTTPLTAISGTSLLTCQSNRFIDNSSNAFTITPNGDTSVQRFSPFEPDSPGYTTAVFGGSGYFDGTGDYLVVAGGSSNAYNFGTGNATVEAWVKTTQTSTGVIASNYSSGLPSVSDQWRVTMGQDVAGRIEWSQGSTVVAYNSKLVNDGAWHHVAAVINGGSVIIYVDGVAGSSASLSGYNYTATTNMYVGVYYYGSDVASPFNGYITNLRINKGTAVYTSNFTPPTSPLTAISGTTALLNFINAGIPDYAMMNDLETRGNAQVSTAQSKFGTGSMSFDGSNSVLYTPVSTKIGLTFTIEFWMYATTSASTNQWLVCSAQGYNSTTYGFLIGYYDTGSGNSISVAGYGLGAYWINGSSPVSANAWHHIAVVGNGTNCIIYADGVSIGSAAWPTSPAYPGFLTNGMYIGAGVTTSLTPINFYGGYIYDLRITNGVCRYPTTFTPPTSAFYTY